MHNAIDQTRPDHWLDYSMSLCWHGTKCGASQPISGPNGRGRTTCTENQWLVYKSQPCGRRTDGKWTYQQPQHFLLNGRFRWKGLREKKKKKRRLILLHFRHLKSFPWGTTKGYYVNMMYKWSSHAHRVALVPWPCVITVHDGELLSNTDISLSWSGAFGHQVTLTWAEYYLPFGNSPGLSITCLLDTHLGWVLPVIDLHSSLYWKQKHTGNFFPFTTAIFIACLKVVYTCRHS